MGYTTKVHITILTIDELMSVKQPTT